MALIQLKNISKNYKDFSLNNISFDIEEGKCLALVGPSGSGKSTLLKTINQLVKQDGGEVIYASSLVSNPQDLIELRLNISYLFQKGLLFPHLSVEENISLPLIESGATKEEADLRVRELLELVELNYKSFRGRMPHEISGGQAQRVSLAQALAIKPKVLLLDEPFNGLDAAVKESLITKLVEIKKSQKLTMILVTHDPAEAKVLADNEFKLGVSKV